MSSVLFSFERDEWIPLRLFYCKHGPRLNICLCQQIYCIVLCNENVGGVARSSRSAANDLNSKNQTWNVSLCTLQKLFTWPRIPNFNPIRCTISPFQDTANFMIFSLTPTWPIVMKTNTLYCPIVGSRKVWLRSDTKTAGGVKFWNFQPYVVVC